MKKTYDTRFKHKLNMLEPGCRILLGVLVLFGAGVICSLLGWRKGMCILFACAAGGAAVLFALVAIELRQDRILNKIAEEEMKQSPDE